MRCLRLLLIIIVGAFLPGAAARGDTVAYAINLIGQFEIVNLNTGVVTPIGPGTPNGLDGLGGRPGGPFFSVDPVTGHLLRVDASGLVTDIGDTGTGPNAGPNGVSLSSSLMDGSLYALDFSNRLLSIDPTTAVVTSLGLVAGLAPSEQVYQGNLFTSLSGNATDLFYTLEIPTGPLQIAPTLYDINALTRAAISRPLLGISDVIGSGWINGTLYGFTGDGNIATINTTTGAATIVAHYDSGQTPGGPPLTGIFGAVAAPEPSSLVLMATALAAITWRRKRS